MKHSHRILVRQWRLVWALHGLHYGLTVKQLIERTGASRASMYRDLRTLVESGAPITKRTSNGQTRYSLLKDNQLPPLAPSAVQIAALHLARAELEPLAGTDLVKELDSLLQRYRPVDPKTQRERQQSFHFARPAKGRPKIMQAIEHALHTRQRVRLVYRAATRHGAESTIEIEPLFVNVTRGDPYIRAYCVERNAERTYKLARIVGAELTKQPATYRPTKHTGATFPHAVKAWSGDPVAVKIRLNPAVAWRAAEYPLVPDQHIHPETDGSAIIEAHVAGLTETARWVVSWGAAAEALEPPALRKAVATELAQALGPYRGPGPAKATPKRNAARTSRLQDRETRRA